MYLDGCTFRRFCVKEPVNIVKSPWPLEAIVPDQFHAHANRLSAVNALLKMKLPPGDWLKLAAKLKDGLVLAEVTAPMGKQKDAASFDFLRGKLKSKSGSVKIAVIGALSVRADKASAKDIQSLLKDDHPPVRMKAIDAMAVLGHRAAAAFNAKNRTPATAGRRGVFMDGCCPLDGIASTSVGDYCWLALISISSARTPALVMASAPAVNFRVPPGARVFSFSVAVSTFLSSLS